jgi:phospholipase D1/2
MPSLQETAICVEERNCWRTGLARRAAFLIDAADYYRAFAEAAEQAKHSIYILAWDINGKIRLRRDQPDETLRLLLLRALNRQPELHVYILSWDYPLIYSDERELLPTFDMPWQIHPRLHFQWDSAHPFGACHHQKVVVIDDQMAFVGGLDFTDERWDMPCHLGFDRRRRGFRTSCYKPFHDAMLAVEGPVARRLGDLARNRWQRAIRYHPDSLHPPALRHGPFGAQSEGSEPSLWPSSVPVEFENVQVSIARTEPAFGGSRQIREIEQLFTDAIARAEHHIYLENQYFTSRVVAEAIARRLGEKRGPEVIVVIPQGCTGWIEEASLGVLRGRLIESLRARDPYHRLHVYYPTTGDLQNGDYIKVHSKVMIVDDRFLRVGSANVCNRSMGMDTECDLVIEARREPDSRAINQVLYRLLAEHLGRSVRDVRILHETTHSLSRTIRQGAQPARRLVPFGGEVTRVWQWVMPRNILLDPERPLEIERLISRELASKGKRHQALKRLLHIGPFWLANWIAFPVLGLWILRKRLLRRLKGRGPS